MQNLYYGYLTKFQKIVLMFNVYFFSVILVMLGLYLFLTSDMNNPTVFPALLCFGFAFYNLIKHYKYFNQKPMKVKLNHKESEFLFNNSAFASCCFLFLTIFFFSGDFTGVYKFIHFGSVITTMLIFINGFVIFKSEVGMIK